MTVLALAIDAFGGRHRYTVTGYDSIEAKREAVVQHAREHDRFIPQRLLILIPGGKK